MVVKNKSIKVNMILNAIKGLMSIFFPLISFPYVSKVLGVDNIGRYNFANSIISYFVLFFDKFHLVFLYFFGNI